MTISLKTVSFFALGTVVLACLYLTSLESYLLFHTFAEMFSVVVACGIFIIGWNSKDQIKNNYLVFLAIAYLFIAFLDLLHTMSYKGMGIFTSYDYYANQLWIATRYLESLSLLLAFIFLHENRRFNPHVIFAGFIAITTLIVGSIFWWKIFPACFVDGQGLTPFKKNSEYIISAILLLDIWLLYRCRNHFDANVHRWLVWSLIYSIAAELAFTFYISNYGFSNLVGHYFKIFSFYLIYKALVVTGITKPHAVLFRALRASENKFRSLVESSADFIWETDQMGVYTYASPHVEDILGYEADEMVGRSMDDFMAPEDASQARELFGSQSGMCPCKVESESNFIHKDGHRVVLERTGTSITDKKGKVVGFRGVDRDVSERRRHERELRKLIRALEHNPISIIITDPEARVEYANPTYCSLMVCTLEECLGQDFVEIVTNGRNDEMSVELRKAFSTGEPWQGELHFKRTDLDYIWVRLSIAPIWENKGLLANHVVTIEDISDHKNLEELKENVDQIMRHDLKAPLNGLISIPQLVAMDSNITDEQREMLMLAEKTGLRMLRMVNNSLNLLKMELGTFEYIPRKVDVLAVTRSVLDEVATTASSLDVELVLSVRGRPTDQPFWIRAEPDLLHRIIVNFLTNALEASPAGEAVFVTLNDGVEPVITIRNRGAVPTEMRDHFFQKYKTHGKKQGTGLGTYSAKLMADAMGFDLHLTISDEDDATIIEIICSAPDDDAPQDAP